MNDNCFSNSAVDDSCVNICKELYEDRYVIFATTCIFP
jgi:hypothetical protein